MKPDTIVKRIAAIIEQGTLPLSLKLTKVTQVKLAQEINEGLVKAMKAAEKLEKLLGSEEPKPVKRKNNLSMKVFASDNYTCQVCGFKDMSTEDLSRVGLIKEPVKTEDYITVCKEHKKEYKKRMPWEQRGDHPLKSLEILQTMQKEVDDFEEKL